MSLPDSKLCISLESPVIVLHSTPRLLQLTGKTSKEHTVLFSSQQMCKGLCTRNCFPETIDLVPNVNDQHICMELMLPEWK